MVMCDARAGAEQDSAGAVAAGLAPGAARRSRRSGALRLPHMACCAAPGSYVGGDQTTLILCTVRLMSAAGWTRLLGPDRLDSPLLNASGTATHVACAASVKLAGSTHLATFLQRPCLPL
jgi:hypothetical protein